MQASRVGTRHLVGARTLNRDVQKSGRSPVAGDPVRGITVDPSLMVGEIGGIAAQLAERRAEGMNHRISRVLRLEREIEGLAEVLRQKTKTIRALQRIGGIEILEDTVARVL